MNDTLKAYVDEIVDAAFPFRRYFFGIGKEKYEAKRAILASSMYEHFSAVATSYHTICKAQVILDMKELCKSSDGAYRRKVSLDDINVVLDKLKFKP